MDKRINLKRFSRLGIHFGIFETRDLNEIWPIIHELNMILKLRLYGFPYQITPILEILELEVLKSLAQCTTSSFLSYETSMSMKILTLILSSFFFLLNKL